MEENWNSEDVRALVKKQYIDPARRRGQSAVAIGVRSVLNELEKAGSAKHKTPVVCSALRGKKFQKENEVVLESLHGPPSGVSPTVVFHFRFRSSSGQVKPETLPESPQARAHRLTEKLRGLLKEELAEYGGGEAFLQREDLLFTSYLVLGEVLAGAAKSPDPAKSLATREIALEMGFTPLPFDGGAIVPFGSLRTQQRLPIC